MTIVSPPPTSYTDAEAQQVFFEDTEAILANLRYILALPMLTDQQKNRVKDIMGSLFELRRDVAERS